MKMNKKELRSLPLLSELSDATWERLFPQITLWETGADECIFPCRKTEDCLCILQSGRASVFSAGDEISDGVLLRTMERGAVFGVTSIFSGQAPQSRIVTSKKSTVLLIPADAWEEVLTTDSNAMKKYVSFLTEKIFFLNRKIRYLTAGSAERRLAAYLLSEIRKDGQPTPLPLSLVALADLLNLGRASLYRALSTLQRDGFLERQGKSYILFRREKLIDFYS